MRGMTLIVGLVLAGVLAQGCISIHTEEVSTSSKTKSRDTTIQEIRIAGLLSFENDREQALTRIARRGGLSGSAQIELVETVFRRLDFEANKVDVLLVLVKNASFSSAAESAILSRISQLSFESNKSDLLDAISKRKG